jgi:uncharacterized protein YidB (DUF937 family)
MGLLDELVKSGGLGAIADTVTSNPQILQAVASLLSNREGSLGGPGGLGALVSAFQSKGLGDVMASWVGGGPNQAVAPDQVTDVLGPEVLGQFAKMAGINGGDAGSVLASVLPVLVNHVTPQGQVPDAGGLDDMLGGLLGQLMR